MNKIKIRLEDTNSDPKSIRHSDEIRDIITVVPSKLIRWGMLLFFCVFMMIIGLAAFIHLPDVVNATLKVNNNLGVEIIIPKIAASKVQAGQEVQIDFKSNLHARYVAVKGRVDSISNALDDNGNLTIHVSITSASNANYFKAGMHGNARVIASNDSILKRLLRNFFH